MNKNLRDMVGLALVSPLYAPLLVALITFTTYLGLLSGEFVADDLALVLDNPWIRDASFIPTIFTESIRVDNVDAPSNFYRPTLHLFYMACYHLFGLDSWGYHLSRLTLHIFSVITVFFLALRFVGELKSEGNQFRRYMPFMAAAIFAIHPVHSEAVAIATSELLFSLFFLLSFYAYMRGTYIGRAVAYVLFFFALLSKETAIVLPIVILVYDYIFNRELFKGAGVKDVLFRYASFAAVFTIYAALRAIALGGLMPLGGHDELTGYERVINIFPLFMTHIRYLL